MPRVHIRRNVGVHLLRRNVQECTEEEKARDDATINGEEGGKKSVVQCE